MKKFISNLTFKKSKIITIAISLFLSLLTIILAYILFFSFFIEQFVLSIFVVTGFAISTYMISYILLGFTVFDLSEKEAKETVIKNFNLAKDNYVEVDYDCTTATKSLLPFLLLVHSEYYFYVKLNENEKLHLLVKTKKQDVIYDSTIRFMYFNAHFKKQK